MLRRWESITGSFGIINQVDNVNWLEQMETDEGLTSETLALKLLTVANLRYELS